MERIRIDSIRMDGGTQPRANINPDTVSDYAESMIDGAEFPPVVIFYDGSDHWLADGFHRVNAAKKAGLKDIDAEVKQGQLRDAVLYSVSANATHGMRRTNADKRRAVEVLLRDEEWGQWSDSKIAVLCAVDHKTVASLRSILGISQDTRTVERNGTIYQQHTAGIGKGKEEREQSPAAQPPPRKTDHIEVKRNPAHVPPPITADEEIPMRFIWLLNHIKGRVGEICTAYPDIQQDEAFALVLTECYREGRIEVPER